MQCLSCFLPRRFLRCSIINNCSVVSLPITQQVILVSRKLSKNFILIFVSTLINQELRSGQNWVLSLFLTVVQNYVQEYHTKQQMATVLKSIHTKMCSLAVHHHAFVSLEGVTKKSEILQKDSKFAENFDFFCESVDIITIRDDKSMKSGI